MTRAELLALAWLRVIQAENSCAVTGKPCREAKRCGCQAEQDMLIQEAKDAEG
jgi:hypothetical protein